MLSIPLQRILQPFKILPQRCGADGHAHVIHKENSPSDEIRREHTVQIFHAASDSRRTISKLPRMASSWYRDCISSTINASMGTQQKNSTLYISGSSPEPGPPMITGCGCCVRHQRIDPHTNGTSINAKIPNSALSSARRSCSSISVRSIRYATYSSQSTAVDVSRASQVHQMPHTGLAQIGPVTRHAEVNARPTSAAAMPSQSHLGLRFNTYATLATKHTKKETSPVSAHGTCRK